MSSLSVLELVQEFCGLQGLPVPTALVGSNETSVVQYRAIAKSLLRDALGFGYKWPERKIRGSFTSVATANQGALSTLFSGFEALIPDTMWLESQTIPVRGPISDSDWAALTALNIAGPPYSYWLSGGNLYLTPTPPAGVAISAVYYTNWLFYDGASPQRDLTDDANTVLISDDVFLLGFAYAWRKVKGLPYANEYVIFQDALSRALSPILPTLALDSQNLGARPQIFIPPGSWVVTP